MKELFKRLIVDFQEKEIEIIPRAYTLPIETSKIVSLIGVRRSGKTYLLYEMYRSLF
ncbi:hypothetical protein NitYY0826_C0959 [Nitratiruptor sp. YY08-26]|uniref:hypothetical protein n=1 Tax=unclassified Nitratiruptor TaxID=2624044 RepID=UPI0019163F09|nr:MULTISPECIES: hypothetical protein [unclassified Nitratiruptor]BCD62090.1 hypothetical protein NitYY0813_C0957 [Nitratiruptor sp. YY08-13]BCD66026.1 hypothetical protein NitYY0826_C0959 [Nitratiruptor sp. YY08-26]